MLPAPSIAVPPEAIILLSKSVAPELPLWKSRYTGPASVRPALPTSNELGLIVT